MSSNNKIWGIRRTVNVTVVLTVLLLLQSIGECQCASFLNWGHHHGATSSSSVVPANRYTLSSTSAMSSFFPSSKKPKDSKSLHHPWTRKIRPYLNNIKAFFSQFVTGDVRKVGPRFVHHILYWLTATDAVYNVYLNEYTHTTTSPLWVLLSCIVAGTPLSALSIGRTGQHYQQQQQHQHALVPSVYSKLFYFARLRPRLLYAIGALLRALQLCTPFRRVLDPTAGVGAGINLCAILAGSRWVKPLVLGWATTKWVRIIRIVRLCWIHRLGVSVCVCLCVFMFSTPNSRTQFFPLFSKLPRTSRRCLHHLSPHDNNYFLDTIPNETGRQYYCLIVLAHTDMDLVGSTTSRSCLFAYYIVYP